jgi:RNA polymerase sigma-70 factor (ECF subfamily)
VLESIYGAFGLAADAVDGAEARITELRGEALHLGALVCRLLPHDAEARGLLALMLFLEARRPAQVHADGAFVPLAAQDAALWDRDAILRADEMLWIAAQARTPGPYQLEAAVQSAHCHRLFSGHTPWAGIAALYAQINLHFPTLGSRVAGAVAQGEAGEPETALAALEQIDGAATRTFQPFWVAKAHLLAMNRRGAEAAEAYTIAIGLSSQARLRAWLEQRRGALET